MSPSRTKIHLLAPLALGEKLKTGLGKRGLLDGREKIQKVALLARGDEVGRRITGDAEGGGVRLLVPTTIMVGSTTVPFSSNPQSHNHQETPNRPDPELVKILLTQINMIEHADQITLILRPSPPTTAKTTDPETPKIPGSTSPSLLARVIDQWQWSRSLPRTASALAPPVKTSSYSWSYTVYPPMLLLPARTLDFVADLVTGYGADRGGGAGESGGEEGGMVVTERKELMEDLYQRLCEAFKVTHIALSGPIPAMMLEEQLGEQDGMGSPTPSCILENTPSEKEENSPSSSPTSKPPQKPNILRSPLNSFTPLHNDFGPSLPAHHVPTRDDFARAFWCTARQNGIFQTWAPRHTMFSRGNLSEKARLLKLLNKPSRTMRMIENNTEKNDVIASVGEGGRSEKEKEPREAHNRERELISAVDLYAGVGYFAFCYAAKKEVVGKVFCWEISRWSVEGLRRGAVGNGWGVKVFEEGEQDGDDDNRTKEGKEERLIVYRESNQHATARVAAMRTRILPVRHVNCGFLPSSKGSWETAVQVLDPIQGGWIHAHENIAIRAFEQRRMNIVQDFRDLVERHHHRGREDEEDEQQQWQVECVHFEKVKTYAPGVVHCVLDISISRLPHPPTDNPPQLKLSTPSVQ